jgi:IS1 family transposase
VIPGTNDIKLVVHVLVNRRIMHTLTDVRRVRGPNCDSDHFLVRIKRINKIMKNARKF